MKTFILFLFFFNLYLSSNNLRKTENNNSNEHLLYIETNASEKELKQIFSEKRFDIVDSIDSKTNLLNKDSKNKQENNNNNHSQILSLTKNNNQETNKEIKEKQKQNDIHYFNLIDYNHEQVLIKSIIKPDDEGITDDAFAYTYSLITFFVVLILAAIGLRFIISCDKNNEQQQNELSSKNELLLNLK